MVKNQRKIATRTKMILKRKVMMILMLLWIKRRNRFFRSLFYIALLSADLNNRNISYLGRKNNSIVCFMILFCK